MSIRAALGDVDWNGSQALSTRTRLARARSEIWCKRRVRFTEDVSRSMLREQVIGGSQQDKYKFVVRISKALTSGKIPFVSDYCANF